jgi:hypothetical protein
VRWSVATGADLALSHETAYWRPCDEPEERLTGGRQLRAQFLAVAAERQREVRRERPAWLRPACESETRVSSDW